MARCIPSACSKALLGASLLLGPALANPWQQARFPVPQFSGYTSHYGLRSGASGGSSLHRGLDIAAPLGSPVLSWWAGRVERLINDGSCGIGVAIRSGPYEHLYCHCRERSNRTPCAAEARACARAPGYGRGNPWAPSG